MYCSYIIITNTLLKQNSSSYNINYRCYQIQKSIPSNHFIILSYNLKFQNLILFLMNILSNDLITQIDQFLSFSTLRNLMIAESIKISIN